MPISMTSTAPGMPAQAYDAAMADVAEPLRRSAGFISHSAQISPDGVTVTELWETAPAGRTAAARRVEKVAGGFH